MEAMPQTLLIRAMVPADWPGIWGLLEPVFRAGETFPHNPAITEAEARHQWVALSQVVVVAVAVDALNSDGLASGEGALVGTYYLKPNSLTLGAHVANAGDVVAEAARRRGIGTRLCQHSLQEAPAARLPRHAIQPGGEHEHRGVGLLASQWISHRGHPARSLPASALRRCRCPCVVLFTALSSPCWLRSGQGVRLAQLLGHRCQQAARSESATRTNPSRSAVAPAVPGSWQRGIVLRHQKFHGPP